MTTNATMMIDMLGLTNIVLYAGIACEEEETLSILK
jgi:hypothetical protein